MSSYDLLIVYKLEVMISFFVKECFCCFDLFCKAQIVQYENLFLLPVTSIF